MDGVSRRAALGFAVTGAALSSGALLYSVPGEAYGADEGQELAFGVRRVELSKGEAIIPRAKTVVLRDVVFQPGSLLPTTTMTGDMICHVTTGELRIVQDGVGFTAKRNRVWTRAKGTQEQVTNEGSGIAVMRVVELLPA